MWHRLKIMSVALALPVIALAGPREEAQAAFDRFFAAFVAGNQDEVAGMFAPDAQFYGTLSPELVTTPEGVRQYFVSSLSGPATVKATLLSSSSLALSDAVVLVAGTWKLERTTDGKTTPFGPFRLSTVLHKRGDRWLISQFHNSPRPASAPAPTAPPGGPAPTR